MLIQMSAQTVQTLAVTLVPLSGISAALTATHDKGNPTTLSALSSLGQEQRTGPAPPPPDRPSDPSRTAAWTQSVCTAGARLRRDRILQERSREPNLSHHQSWLRDTELISTHCDE